MLSLLGLGERDSDVDKEGNKSGDEERLDKFELSPEVEEEEGDVSEVFEEEVDVKMKLLTILKDHVKYLEGWGASQFSLSVIKEGYKQGSRKMGTVGTCSQPI